VTGPGSVIIGPALPVLDDLRDEFPGWHCWRGVGGRLYARLRKSSPPFVVGAAGTLALPERIREAGTPR
jgi:hypothetical protein